ncbi:BsuBI/PstI family type II restriction endonuclease [Heliomicrobium gestii]|uniref:BsuBI/PstI family type II restriction endonuclease n=1 Tax=Heliomicrobium gestii TaxID=2699 RepID=UPI0014794C5E|nr:BsuBI/PstI family type II restriction endonuclease [Heliomicrobium gestii]MBM7865789.1 hypothetical protein [Heliomicrobium gestii]
MIVFVEVVATDGPISQQRKEALQQIAVDAGFKTRDLAFVTAFEDRQGDPAAGGCLCWP